jgi:hypothetical protein
MPYGDAIARVDFSLRRDSAFSYVCNACNRCCHGKAIRVGPYEALRLSRRLGISTTEFFARYTEAGGTVLQTRPDDRGCVFLGPRGCTVHPDRPLPCRLYPLARWISPEGDESFGHLEPHPRTAGVYGAGGTVEDFLQSQGLPPYFAMGDRYGALYDRMVAIVERLDPGEDVDRRTERRAEVDEMEAGTLATAWFDVDAAVGDYCRERGLAVPEDLDAFVDLHLKAIGVWLDSLEAALPT